MLILFFGMFCLPYPPSPMKRMTFLALLVISLLSKAAFIASEAFWFQSTSKAGEIG